jgi:cell division protein FtsA
MPRQKRNIIATLDIGSTKIICMIAQLIGNGEFKILGVGYTAAQGIKAGKVANMQTVCSCISKAMEIAEKEARVKIERTYVSVSATHVLSKRMGANIIVKGHEINHKDVNNLIFQLEDKYGENGFEIIQYFPCEYTLDGVTGIENPLGMVGEKLSCDFSLLLSPTAAVNNLEQCMTKCQLSVENYVASPYAAALACLSDDERDIGSIIIDCGGGVTSFSLFQKGKMMFSDSIAIGGNHVTQDLAMGLNTDYKTAERLKILHGSVIINSIDRKQKIEVISDNEEEGTLVDKSLLIEIIAARVEEIAEIIRDKMLGGGVKNISSYRIVLTGGSSQINGTEELFSQVLGSSKIRTARPRLIQGLAPRYQGLSFATSVGLMLHASNHEYSMHGDRFNHKGRFFGGISDWLKSNVS